jgi:hypothetical protein
MAGGALGLWDSTGIQHSSCCRAFALLLQIFAYSVELSAASALKPPTMGHLGRGHPGHG